MTSSKLEREDVSWYRWWHHQNHRCLDNCSCLSAASTAFFLSCSVGQI